MIQAERHGRSGVLLAECERGFVIHKGRRDRKKQVPVRHDCQSPEQIRYRRQRWRALQSAIREMMRAEGIDYQTALRRMVGGTA